jgi:hypothetical protein
MDRLKRGLQLHARVALPAYLRSPGGLQTDADGRSVWDAGPDQYISAHIRPDAAQAAGAALDPLFPQRAAVQPVEEQFGERTAPERRIQDVIGAMPGACHNLRRPAFGRPAHRFDNRLCLAVELQALDRLVGLAVSAQRTQQVGPGPRPALAGP